LLCRGYIVFGNKNVREAWTFCSE